MKGDGIYIIVFLAVAALAGYVVFYIMPQAAQQQALTAQQLAVSQQQAVYTQQQIAADQAGIKAGNDSIGDSTHSYISNALNIGKVALAVLV